MWNGGGEEGYSEGERGTMKEGMRGQNREEGKTTLIMSRALKKFLLEGMTCKNFPW